MRKRERERARESRRDKKECQSGCISLLKLQKSGSPRSNGMWAIYERQRQQCVCVKIDVKGNTLTCGHEQSHEHKHNYRLKSCGFMSGLANTETGLTLISRNGTLGRCSHYRLVKSLQLLPEKRQRHVDRQRAYACVSVFMSIRRCLQMWDREVICFSA